MKSAKITIAGNIGLLVFGLILLLSASTIAITYISTYNFHIATTQLLNRDVATHIAKFTSPFEGKEIDKERAETVIYNAMVLNPTAEVYFLDPSGHIIYYQKKGLPVKNTEVPLGPIISFITYEGRNYIKNSDPREPREEKIFSAAEVKKDDRLLGYIYVILGSYEYRSVNSILFGNHATALAIKTFLLMILFSVLASLFYIKRLQNKFSKINKVIARFREGDLHARFETHRGDELSPVTDAFNEAATQLSAYILKLKALELERNDFIANISHDLKTPLSVAHGYAETLIMNNDNAEVSRDEEQQYLQIICRKIEQVENLVLELSELSKLESQGFTPDKEPFVFAEILEEATSAFQRSAEVKNITLLCEGCQETALIFADIKMMERVVQNLIDNAIKHTPEGEKILIKLAVLDKSLVLTLENSGNNLNPDILDWINSLESQIRVTSYSTGLGLAIIKKIILLHSYMFSVLVTGKPSNIFTIRMGIYCPRN